MNRYHGMINGALAEVEILCFLLVPIISCQTGAAGLLCYHILVVYSTSGGGQDKIIILLQGRHRVQAKF